MEFLRIRDCFSRLGNPALIESILQTTQSSYAVLMRDPKDAIACS